VSIEGPLSPGDIPVLCRCLLGSLAGIKADIIVCDLSELGCADLVAIDALANLQLVARRRGSRLCLFNPSADLLELLALLGMCDVLPLLDRSSFGPASRRQTDRSLRKDR
jgi:anti-anti-sigma regulatory factor